MKIKKTQLKQIVKEELEKVLEAEHGAEPSMKDMYMEVVDNLYRSYGEEMEEDVESALQGLSDIALAYAIFTVVERLPKPATSTHDQAVDILQKIKAEGGINGLFRQGLKAVESKGMK